MHLSRIWINIVVVIFLSVAAMYVPASAASVAYTYDDLNRLIKVDYGDGTVIEYTYDAAGNRLIQAVPNRPPMLGPIGSKSVNEGSALTFTVSGSDLDENPLALSATSLPAGATFDSTSRTFSWTPSYTQAGVYSVTFAVSDGNLTTSEVVSITVNEGLPVTSASPNAVTYGITTSRSITIYGSSFALGARITVGSLSGVTVSGSTASTTTPFVFTSSGQVKFYWATTSLPPAVYDVQVTNPNGTSGTLTGGFTVAAPQPAISFVNPASVTYGVTTSRAGTLDGTNFVAGATVTIGGLTGVTVTGSTATAGVPFVHVTATRLSVWWPSTGLAPGAYTVTVTNPAAAGGLSVSAVNGFTVVEPLPTISLVSPTPVTYGVTTSRALTINGTNFVVGATVTIGGLTGVTVTGSTATVGVPFVQVSATRLSVWWPTTGLAPGAYSVTVTNPAAAGGLSVSLGAGLTVVEPQPTISFVNPASVTYGVTASRAVTLDGTNFVAGATVTIGGLTGVTVNGSTATAGVRFVHVSATRLSMWWPSTGVAPGAYTVTVTNPAAAGGLSVSLASGLTVVEPQPTISLVSPTPVTYGVTTSRALTINGTNFVVGATVTLGSLTGATVNGSTATAGVPFVHVTATRLSVWWPTAGLAPGAYPVTVTNPTASGGLSVSMVGGFTVVEPLPTISLVSPTPVTYGVTTSRALTINGTNFVVGATVTIGGLTGVTVTGSTATAGMPFVHVTATRLSVWWPTTGLAPGAYTVTVTNPAAAGGLSVSLASGLTVVEPQPTISLVSPTPVTYGVTTSRALTINGTNFVAGATVTIGSLTGVTVTGSTATAGVPFVQVSATRLSVWWPTAGLAPGAYAVTVTNPAAAGGLSVSAVGGFTVVEPLPTISLVSPASVTYGVTSTSSITISGTNFVLGATVTVGSLTGATVPGSTATATTRFVHVSSTQLRFYWANTSLPPGAYAVQVTNPTTAGGLGATFANGFTVAAPQPTVSIVSPTPVIYGTTGSGSITIYGSNFVLGATITVGGLSGTTMAGSTATTTNRFVQVTNGQLKFYWGNTSLPVGSYNVEVTNPLAAGGATGSLTGGFVVQ
jgi:YD repeat-containing protein